MYPNADVPVLQVSLPSENPQELFALGRERISREQLRELFHAGLDVRSLRVSTVVIVAPASLQRRSTGLSPGGVIVCG